MDYAKILLWDRKHLLNFLWQSELKTTNDVIFNIFHTPVPGTFNWAGGEPMRELKKTDGHDDSKSTREHQAQSCFGEPH